MDITGTPANGYQVGTVSCSPKYAEVTGSKEDLEALLSIHLDSIDVSGRTAAVTKTFNLENYLPDGISLNDDSRSSVQVTVSIETAQKGKQFTLDESRLTILGQEDGKTYSFGTAHVTVTGDSSSLNRTARRGSEWQCACKRHVRRNASGSGASGFAQRLERKPCLY